jgi:hypothetical protein
MRARNIKPGFFKNDALADLSPYARLLFIGLWLLADREGRLEYRPKKIKAEIFPFESVDVGLLFQELAKCEDPIITLYEVENFKYVQILNFVKHQKPHSNEVESTLPSAIGAKLSTMDPSAFDQGSKHLPPRIQALGPERGKMNDECGMMNDESGASAFSSKTAATPPKEVKPAPPRGTRLNPEWSPKPETIEQMRKERPDLRYERTLASFRDYWIAKAGKDGVKLDWEATFRNWFRNERAAPAHTNPSHTPLGPVNQPVRGPTRRSPEEIQAMIDEIKAKTARLEPRQEVENAYFDL